MRAFAAILLIATSPALFAQSSPALPGCEPRPEVRQVLDEKLSEKILQEMKFTERVAFRRQVLEDLIAKYPREVEPYRRLIQATKEEDTDHYPALVDRYQKQAEQHPDDPLTLYTAGLALSGMDTPQSIRLLEQARSQAPSFVWPALELAHIFAGYQAGGQEEGRRRGHGLLCRLPVVVRCRRTAAIGWRGFERTASARGGGPAGAARHGNGSEAAEGLQDSVGPRIPYAPPHEHDALRKQVAADLQRLESLNPKPDAGWLVFLKNGYKQSDAPPETVAAMEDRVIRTVPHSDEAYRIVSDRWDMSTKEPEDQNDAAAWAKYHGEYREALKGWIARFTESRELRHEAWFEAIYDDSDLPAEEGLRAMDDFLAEAAYQPREIGHYLWATSFLIDHKWQPRRVFDLLRDSDKLMDQWHVRMLGDNLSDEAEDVWASNETIRRQAAAGDVLVAA